MGRSAKAQLEQAFHKLGGVPALVRWGKNNQTEFYKLWGKIIPMSVDAKMQFERLTIMETPTPGAQQTIEHSPAQQAGAAAMEIIEGTVIDELEQRQSDDDNEIDNRNNDLPAAEDDVSG